MEEQRKTTVEVSDAVKIYGEQTVLDHVSLKLEAGHIYGFIGQNGSGKTVLFKSICGFTKLTEGSVQVLGKKIGEDTDMAQGVGAIIETPGFLPNYSGFQNLNFLASLKGVVSKEEIREYIQKVGLDPDSRKKVGKYSMGMRQRLGIAQALMENPPILILDEPFNGLDKNGVGEMRRLLLDEKKNGKTIILASHAAEDIEILCDEVYDMEMGRCTRLESEEEQL